MNGWQSCHLHAQILYKHGSINELTSFSFLTHCVGLSTEESASTEFRSVCSDPSKQLDFGRSAEDQRVYKLSVDCNQEMMCE